MELRELLSHPAVRSARALIHASDERTLSDQLDLVRIPAPSFAEETRAQEVRRRMQDYGLTQVHRDEAGNVLGALPGAAAERAVVLCAHLDTVFPAETDLTVRRSGERIQAPGITDNARGLAALLALARVLVEAGITTLQPVLFVATVGEEGLGDLRGVKHLFRAGSPQRSAAACIALDGSGLQRIVHRAVGSRRLRLHVSGPGGHSWADWGTANPVHALGRVIAGLRALELPSSPRTTLSVNRVGGGTSVNTIPGAAWLELDLRSESREAIERLDASARVLAAETITGENRQRRRGTAPLRDSIECIGDRPSGRTPSTAALVRAAAAATRALGERPSLVASSTDANVPISLGIPAITLGAGGESGGIHTSDEWYANIRGPEGIERALLTVLAVAGITERA